jgi:hypothetical protein
MRLIDYLLIADMNSLKSKYEIILWTGEKGAEQFKTKNDELRKN